MISDGRKIEGPKALRRHLKKLVRLQRQHARKAKGGKNRAKSRRKIARLHARIRNLRQDGLHKLTTSLARDHSVVVIVIAEHRKRCPCTIDLVYSGWV
jgi:putative transposase